MRLVIRFNETIRAPEVRVIDHDGTMLGVLPVARAIAKARERGLHLVEVNPLASPPVCKIVQWTHGPGPPDAIIGPERRQR